ncbi:MAG: hypothetical protein A2X12_05340 [Bacteroidetes bacterium GWE2_29_8]|nr:MAG: hypothetical protein A2X12_05340 [Bacteroidetes bacterium GWE2_29_8]OFY25317.1 MAG: hypothetical protein A2X02_09925 [Bacteroidetes bacterium GWF2_29_10]
MKLAIISDIHEDIISLQKAMNLCDKMRCDDIICLGDIVGYCKPFYNFDDTRNANAVVNLVKQHCSIVVSGNHDMHAIKKKCKTNDYDVWDYEGEMDAMINSSSIEYLDKLPEYIVKEFDGINMLFSHFVYPNTTGCFKYIPKSIKDIKQHYEFMHDNNCQISFCGHLHTQNTLIGKEKGMMSFMGIPFMSDWRSKIKLNKNDRQSIVLRPLVRTDKPHLKNGFEDIFLNNNFYSNGFIIFDTESFELKIIPIN